MKSHIRGVFVTSFALAVALTATTPATAALPPGDHLVTIGCQGENGRLIDVDVDDATGMLLGDPIAETQYQCGLQGAFDPVTGFIYYPQMGDNGVDNALYQADLDGMQLNLGDFHLSDSTAVEITSLAINSVGHAFGFDMDENLYSIDLTTAEVTLVGSSAQGGYSYQSLAFDRTDNTLYAMRDGVGSIYTVNVDTGAVTSTGISIPNYVMGITFDDAGLMYILTDDILSELSTYDFDTSTLTQLAGGALLSAGGNYYTQSAVYYGEVTGGGVIDNGGSGDGGSDVGGSGLAATGLNVVPLALCGLATLAVGVLVRRRRA